MKVTQLVFDAFLRCPTKRYLIARGEAGDRTAAERVDEAYRQDGLERLNAELSSDVAQRRTSAGRPLEAGTHGLIGRLDAETHPVRIQAHERQRDRDHVPIRFVSEEEVSLTPKLSLAFDALVLAESTGTRPLSGEIIHGRDYPTVKVPLSALYPKVQSSLTALNQQLTSATAPDPVLN